AVTEQNFRIRTVQRRERNRHAVFFSHAQEVITYQYERDPTDPCTQHKITLEVDSFGNVLHQAAVGYGRRNPDLTLPTSADRFQQKNPHITYTVNGVTNALDTLPDTYRTPLPCETRI